MVVVLRFLGWASIICGIIIGIILGILDDPLARALRYYDDGFRFAVAITWWISGAISGIVFLSLAYILEYVESIHEMLKDYTRSSSSTYPETGKSSYSETGKQKRTLDNVKDYKMKSID